MPINITYNVFSRYILYGMLQQSSLAILGPGWTRNNEDTIVMEGEELH